LLTCNLPTLQSSLHTRSN